MYDIQLQINKKKIHGSRSNVMIRQLKIKKPMNDKKYKCNEPN